MCFQQSTKCRALQQPINYGDYNEKSLVDWWVEINARDWSIFQIDSLTWLSFFGWIDDKFKKEYP